MNDSGAYTDKPGNLKNTVIGIVKSLGIVFGDIGTSPLYTLPAIFLFVSPTVENVMGVVSLIIWTLVALVFVEYSMLAMSLSRKGEGGTIVLREILKPLLKRPGQVAFVTFLSFIGVSLFMGDGVITPAMSILSAVEGLRLIPEFTTLGCGVIVMISCLITIVLFYFQKKGVENVSKAFGPIMVIWFISIFVSGMVSILSFPKILCSLNPINGLNFLINNGFTAFFILSGVILCATGAEALYADMGHLGRKPIQHAWYFVFIALIFNYMGQGAFLINHPKAKQIIYEMFFQQASFLYIPFLIVSLLATIIASQAMISGIFSVVYQCITTQILPRFQIEYTSSRMHSQVYIGFINWVLLVAVLFTILNFKESMNLAAAYGFAASGTMVITATLMVAIFSLRKNRFKQVVSVLLLLLNLLFFSSTLFKVPHGGYWSIIFATIPFSIFLIFVAGQTKLRKSLNPMLLENFLEKYNLTFESTSKISGTALFFTRQTENIQSYVTQTMFDNKIVYQDNILISVIRREDPFGVIAFFKGDLAPGLRIFEIHCGYMEVLNVEKIIKNAGIHPKAIFYGLDEIVSKSLIWRIFAVIKRLVPNFARFYKLPYNKLHGVVTLVEM